MFNHPELKENELFIGNFKLATKNIAFHEATYVPSRRYGDIAYDYVGNKMEGWIPVFIFKSDIQLHNKLATDFTFKHRG